MTIWVPIMKLSKADIMPSNLTTKYSQREMAWQKSLHLLTAKLLEFLRVYAYSDLKVLALQTNCNYLQIIHWSTLY